MDADFCLLPSIAAIMRPDKFSKRSIPTSLRRVVTPWLASHCLGLCGVNERVNYPSWSGVDGRRDEVLLPDQRDQSLPLALELGPGVGVDWDETLGR